MSAGQVQAVFFGEDGEMAGAGIEPDVENVGFLAEGCAAALGALAAGAHEFGGGFGIPNVGGVLAELRDDAIENRFIGEWLGAAFAIEDGDGHAPDALARDAPIGARRDHVGHALFAPGGIPLNFLDGFESFFAEVFAVHADEPLFGGAEDERRCGSASSGDSYDRLWLGRRARRVV